MVEKYKNLGQGIGDIALSEKYSLNKHEKSLIFKISSKRIGSLVIPVLKR